MSAVVAEHEPSQGAAPRLTLWEILREDFRAHDRDWTRPGFRAVAVHRLGAARRRIRSRVLRAPFSILYRAAYRFVRNVYGIELPDTVRVGRRVVFEHQHGIVIHGRAEIGDDCVIRHGVTLGIRSMNRLDEAPVLGNRVNVGAGAKILGGVHVGDDAAIGANAVVLDDVPDGALAVGVPATLVSRASSRRRDFSAAASIDARPSASVDTRTSLHRGTIARAR